MKCFLLVGLDSVNLSWIHTTALMKQLGTNSIDLSTLKHTMIEWCDKHPEYAKYVDMSVYSSGQYVYVN